MKNIASASLYRQDGYRTIVKMQSGPVEITDAEIILNSMTIDSTMIEGDTFEIGNAISDQVVLTLDNSEGTYSSAFVGVEFDLYIAPFPVDGSVARADADWSLLGTYIVTQADTSFANRVTLTLNDRFVLMDQKIPPGTFSTSSTLYQHLLAFCATLGIGLSLTNAEQTFLSNITVIAPNSNTAWFADMTYRDFVRGIAGIMWENAKMTPDGSLAFRQFKASSITTSPSNRYKSSIQESVYIGPLEVVGINGVVYYTTGSHDGQRITIDEASNQVVQLIGPTLLSGYYGSLTVPGASVVDTQYSPMTMTCLPFWEAESGDGITYTDKDGNTISGIITSMGGVINGAMSITSAGASAQQQFQYIGKLTSSDLSTLHAVQTSQNQITDMLPVVEGFNTSIQQMRDSIMSSVESAYIKANDFNRLYESHSTAINQTSEDIQYLFNNQITMTDVDGAIDEYNSNVISKYIRFSQDGIEIGEEGNALILKIDNDEIGFYKNGSRVAYWDGQTLRTGDAYIELNHQFRLGNFAAYPRTNGSVSWLKVGG